MQDEVDPFRGQQVIGQRGQHSAGGSFESNLGIAGPGAHDASPWTPDIVVTRIRLEQAARQAFDTCARANAVNAIDGFVVEFALDHRLQVTA